MAFAGIWTTEYGSSPLPYERETKTPGIARVAILSKSSYGDGGAQRTCQ